MKQIFLIFLLIFLIGCAGNPDRNADGIFIDNGKNLVKVSIEIADDNQARMKGLMFRESLGQNSGMLFIFDDEKYYGFWMKNTLIPLDMIFMDKSFKIVDIKHAVPCTKEPCGVYMPSQPAKYVLEVNENFTIRNSISIGDKILTDKKYG